MAARNALVLALVVAASATGCNHSYGGGAARVELTRETNRQAELVLVDGRVLSGTISSVEPDAVLFTTAQGVSRIRLDQVREVIVNRRLRGAGDGALVGGLLGAGLGVAVGLAFGDERDVGDACTYYCPNQRELGLQLGFLGAVAGVEAGVLVGLLTGSSISLEF